VAAAGAALGLELTGFELFEKIGVEDGGADLVIARSPLAEVDQAAAIGAEGNIRGVERDFFAADGTVQSLGYVRYSMILATTS
jgi:hypothetical protein